MSFLKLTAKVHKKSKTRKEIPTFFAAAQSFSPPHPHCGPHQWGIQKKTEKPSCPKWESGKVGKWESGNFRFFDERSVLKKRLPKNRKARKSFLSNTRCRHGEIENIERHEKPEKPCVSTFAYTGCCYPHLSGILPFAVLYVAAAATSACKSSVQAPTPHGLSRMALSAAWPQPDGTPLPSS